MNAILIILGIVVYFGIGGFLAGLFNELYFDSFFWYILWPLVLVLLLFIFFEQQFENIGYDIRDKLNNRKKK